MPFQPVDSKPNFISLEHKILKFWKENDILQKYLKRNEKAPKRFSFLDGPITANNPMGVHHAWGRTLKDLYQRYHTMRGCKQRYQNGFDNQGLWVEVEVEKKLGFKSKKDIEKYGIAKFVNDCKEHTQKFAQVQTEQSKRLGYFMDWGSDYYTMSDQNNYAIWHFLKKCWRDGFLYKGRDSVPWCPRCGTAISQHEILSEEYKELTHDSIYFSVPIEGRKDERFLVWTTTPWTLPANVALAVHPELEYWLVGGYWVVGTLAFHVFGKKVNPLKKVRGEELVGLKYQGPFDDFPAVKKAAKEDPKTFHSVVASKEFVNDQEGTGIVHIATGCGQEDFQLGKEEDLPVIEAIDEAANYLEGFGDLSGKNAKDNPQLVLNHPLLKGETARHSEFSSESGRSEENKILKQVQDDRSGKGYTFKIEPYTHRYPICWRCKTELVWRVVDEWYVGMDRGERPLRQRMIDVAKQIKWIPEFGLARELDWLNNMHDWLISKKRYWGLCLPIWECECGHFEVIGSKEELKERAVKGWKEFEGHTPHRPWVDAVKIKCGKCGKVASRVLDVGNPWLDAGIVAYSTLGYFDSSPRHPERSEGSQGGSSVAKPVLSEAGGLPQNDVEGKEYWKQWFPADLVLECFPGQFKNWFYSLIAMSTALEDKPPYKTLLGHALVHDEKGEEMHKSKGNAIWFDEAAEKMGVDVMRWMYVTQNPRIDLKFGYGIADEVRRRFFLILWNVYKFFVTYANVDGFDPSSLPRHPEPRAESRGEGSPHDQEGILPSRQARGQNDENILDRWILSRLNYLIEAVTKALDGFDNSSAAQAIEEFVINDLSTWYVRRSRDRIGPTADDGEDKDTCYETLYEVLATLMKLLAPFVPFIAEEMWRNLRNTENRKQKTGVGGNIGSENASIHLGSWPILNSECMDSSLEEKMVAVREIVEKGHAARKAAKVKVRQPLRKLTAFPTKGWSAFGRSFKLLGDERELIELIKDELNVREVVFHPSHHPEDPERAERVEGDEGPPHDQEEILPSRQARGQNDEKKGPYVELDTEITSELKAEGQARELIREIQKLRKKKGCKLDQKISVTYSDTPENRQAVEKFGDYIKRKTLARELKPGEDLILNP